MSWEDRSRRIDHDGPDLLWQQVADDLRDSIRRGELPERSKIPSEPELASIYGVARVTIRAAVAALREEGVLTVTPGRGTFVARSGDL